MMFQGPFGRGAVSTAVRHNSTGAFSLKLRPSNVLGVFNKVQITESVKTVNQCR